jgi:hypothetical protein
VVQRVAWEVEWPRLLPPSGAKVVAGSGGDDGGCEP